LPLACNSLPCNPLPCNPLPSSSHQPYSSLPPNHNDPHRRPRRKRQCITTARYRHSTNHLTISLLLPTRTTILLAKYTLVTPSLTPHVLACLPWRPSDHGGDRYLSRGTSPLQQPHTPLLCCNVTPCCNPARLLSVVIIFIPPLCSSFR
jgi:hypothetical protein